MMAYEQIMQAAKATEEQANAQAKVVDEMLKSVDGWARLAASAKSGEDVVRIVDSMDRSFQRLRERINETSEMPKSFYESVLQGTSSLKDFLNELGATGTAMRILLNTSPAFPVARQT